MPSSTAAMQVAVNVMANASTTPDRFARSDRFARCMSFLSVNIAAPPPIA
jgi:hypothetical protein